jgi:hypothetical protein
MLTTFASIAPKEGDMQGGLAWRPLRRGIDDLIRRAEVSRKPPNATWMPWPASTGTPRWKKSWADLDPWVIRRGAGLVLVDDIVLKEHPVPAGLFGQLGEIRHGAWVRRRTAVAKIEPNRMLRA